MGLFLLAFFAHSSLYGLLVPDSTSMVDATTANPAAILEVWNPDLRSSNITSVSLFPVGSEFSVRVNVTNAGSIAGFDLGLNYNVTSRQNIIQAIKTGNELSGGLFDPNHPPTGCQINVLKNEIDRPPGRIRFAAAILGSCSAGGTGTLLTITFRVTGTGASFIDIVRTDSSGQAATTIVGPAPTASVIPFQPLDARFQNRPGIPPVARFTYDPQYPIKGDTINFYGGLSYDPDNYTAPSRGIKTYQWFFGDGTGQLGGSNASHTFFFPILIPAFGNFSVTLVVWDFDNLPGRLTQIVNVSPGIREAASHNWSGYAVSSTPGSVTDAKGSWIVPKIVAGCGTTDEYASFWVGIDGYGSSTVEQTGTDSACVAGAETYYAWYEFYPNSAHLIRRLSVHPGDRIFAEVSFSRGRFNVTIADLSTGKSFTKLARVGSAQRSSAEWIAEAPSSTGGVVPLADFGTVLFGQDYTGIPNSSFATVDGKAGSVGSFGSRAARITMISPSFVVKAAVSRLSTDLTSFAVQWRSPGP